VISRGGGVPELQPLIEDDSDVLGTLLRASPDAVLVVDEEGVVALASPAIQTLFGFEPHEVVGQTIEMLIPEKLRAIHERHRSSYSYKPRPRAMGVSVDLVGRRRDGSQFPIDVGLAPFSAGGQRFVAAFVRDATDRYRQEARLVAINEITQLLLAGESTEVILELVARRARGLVNAPLGWVVVPEARGDLVIRCANGELSESLIGLKLQAETSISSKAMTNRTSILVDDLSAEVSAPEQARALRLGPALFCPLGGEDRKLGVLVVARGGGAPSFTSSDASLVEVFANAASIALTLGQARVELEQLQVAAEHERIGRDLHDTVIQRLFALGMGLQAIEQLAGDPVAERIDRVVDGLDEVIRDIRETIFNLERPSFARSGLRAVVTGAASAATEQLGFAPRVGFQGPVDSVTSENLHPHVIAVLTEALSNVARHARASSVDVVVAAEDGTLLISVADNGIGLPQGRTAGNGLRNIAERARVLAGSVSVTSRSPSGTLLEWRVPLDE